MFTSKVRPGIGPIALPQVKFAITGNPRTGTSHLASLLDSHPDVACWDDEIFDAGEAFDSSGCDSPYEFLIRYVFRVRAQAVGFKLLWDALDRRYDILDAVESLGFVLLHVYRENLLDSFISFQLATLNQAFTNWYGEYSVTKFEADYDQCLEWFELCELRDSAIREGARRRHILSLEIEYAELCQSQDKVLDFLQVPRRPLKSALEKQTHGTRREMVSNYDELSNRFVGSRWHRFFEH